jgi:L-ascorbate metabolism protein UlaG (beta-lactamase superfamily)
MNITWLGQGGFLFEYNGTRVVVDPYLSNCLASIQNLERLFPNPMEIKDLNPDMVISTHDHLDHFDPDTIQPIVKEYPDCIIAGPGSVIKHAKELNIPDNKLKILNKGSKISCGDISFTGLKAYHSDPLAIGLLIEFENEKIYLSGDSEYKDDLTNDIPSGIKTVFICINGKFGNMNIDEAVKIVKEINPETAIPMHYGLFAENTVDPEPFVEKLKDLGINSILMETGKSFTI